MINSALRTSSSSVTRSAGSVAVAAVAVRSPANSIRSESNARSRRRRAELIWSRQIRLVTTMSHARSSWIDA